MEDAAPMYAQEFEEPVEAVFSSSGPFGIGWSPRVLLRQGETELAKVRIGVDLDARRRFGSERELGRIEFGSRTFRLTMPPDRTLGEWLKEWFSRYRRRRVWRAGSGIVTEIRDITQEDQSALKGTFQRDGTSYVVERSIETGLLGRSEGDVRVMANHREVARVEQSLEDKGIMVVTPSTPLRLDVIAIAFYPGMSLAIPRGTGGGAGAGAGGGGGGGC